MRPVALVAGYAVRFPLGGMTWVVLNHLLGLAALGFEPVYVEAGLWPQSCYDPRSDTMTDDASHGIDHLRRAAADVGLPDLQISYLSHDERAFGVSRDRADAVLADAAVLVNVGASTWHPTWAEVPRRILLDCDAPFTQIAIHRGVEPISGIAANHDVWATIATNVAQGRCPAIPLDRPWIASRPPVHTPAWPVTPLPAGGAWTTVTSWGSAARGEWQGMALGNKADAYEPLLDLPALVDAPLELAVAADAPADELRSRGWRVVDPVPHTLHAADFTDYVLGSRGELAVAKQAYAAVRTGAMNDRSLAYLAAGRPVVASDIGTPAADAGYLTFDDADGAAAALRAVEAEPDRHARAARRFVERHHEATDVLADLLAAADVALPAPVAGPATTVLGARP